MDTEADEIGVHALMEYEHNIILSKFSILYLYTICSMLMSLTDGVQLMEKRWKKKSMTS